MHFGRDSDVLRSAANLHTSSAQAMSPNGSNQIITENKGGITENKGGDGSNVRSTSPPSPGLMPARQIKFVALDDGGQIFTVSWTVQRE